jgi:hypothetical protein
LLLASIAVPDHKAKTNTADSSPYAVRISQDTLCKNCTVPIIHLAEIKLFSGWNRVNITGIQMSSTLAQGYSGSFCMDGRYGTLCQTALDDAHPSITISAASAFDRMEVYNKGEKTGRDRIVGAVVSSTGLGVVGNPVFSSAAWKYTFLFGPPRSTSAPLFAPSASPSSPPRRKPKEGPKFLMKRLAIMQEIFDLNYTLSITFRLNYVNMIATYKNDITNSTADTWRPVGPTTASKETIDGGRVR